MCVIRRLKVKGLNTAHLLCLHFSTRLQFLDRKFSNNRIFCLLSGATQQELIGFTVDLDITSKQGFLRFRNSITRSTLEWLNPSCSRKRVQCKPNQTHSLHTRHCLTVISNINLTLQEIRVYTLFNYVNILGIIGPKIFYISNRII